MNLYLAFDTSNYTTSAALYDADRNVVLQEKKLLPVKPGEKGIRQSDAVYHHTQQLPDVLSALLEDYQNEYGVSDTAGLASAIRAVGVSTRPRRVDGSYMPCFSVGAGQARTVAGLLNVPLYEFSHQEGHIAAALYSADRLDLVGSDFLAFHVSGGTTESLAVHAGVEAPLEADLVGTSSDLKAGQAIDRTGVMLGLAFPAGPALEQLALQSTRTFKIRPSMKGLNCSLSGVENKCRQMYDKGEAPEDIALFCLKYVEVSLKAMAEELMAQYPGRHIVFSGGVMSNGIIRRDFLKTFDCSFAEPVYSADNAAGVAVLTALQHQK